MVHGVAACALVEHGLYVGIGQNMFAHLADEFVFVQIMGDGAVGKIADLVAIGQIVHGNDVGDAARIESVDDIAADKAGRTGYDDGHGETPCLGWGF